MSVTNTHGVHITQVSDYVKKWYKYMPDDITQEMMSKFEQEHEKALSVYPEAIRQFITKDVTYPGVYAAQKLREHGTIEKDVQAFLFTSGRQAFMDQRNHWKNTMVRLEKHLIMLHQ